MLLPGIAATTCPMRKRVQAGKANQRLCKPDLAEWTLLTARYRGLYCEKALRGLVIRMRSGVPWSVKGIEPEAREAAKQAAHRAGVTLGAWLNQMIMEAGTDEVGRPGERTPAQPQNPFGQFSPQQAAPQAPVMQQIDMAPVADALRDIVHRVEGSERRTSDLARRLEQTVGQLAERVELSERAMEQSSDPRTLDPLERKIQQLAERLEEAERGRSGGKRSDDKAIQTLEKAVNAVVDHLDMAERRTDESLAEIRKTLMQVATRVDEREEEEEREEALARSRALETHLQTLATRLEKMEHSVGSVGPRAVESALKAIAEKTDAEQHKATIAGMQSLLSDITHRLERAEARTDETLKAFEKTVASIARRLEDLDRPRNDVVPEAVHVIESRIEQIASRLQQNEEMTSQAAQTIERAIAGMSDSLHVTENRSRETIESLHVMLERMTDRLGRLEKDTKAALSKPLLSPQVAVGHTPGNGYVPGAQAFPVPHFDAPPASTFGGPFGVPGDARQPAPAQPGIAGFRNPFDEDTLPEQARSLPMPMPAPVRPERPGVDHQAASEPVPEIPSDIPPPFASEESDAWQEPGDDMPAPEEDDGVIPPDAPPPPLPLSESAREAHDFLAAARRAAQAAAEAGRHGQPTPGATPYGPAAGRFTAIDAEREGRRKKFIFGFLAVALVAAAAVAALRFVNGQAPIPQIGVETTGPAAKSPDALAGKPQAKSPGMTQPMDMGASTETNLHPEANPEDAGAKAASSSTSSTKETAPASTTASPATEPVSPIVPSTKPKKPARETTLQGTEEKGPTLTPAPAKPVTSAPLAAAGGQALGQVPAGEDALGAQANKGDAAAQYELGQRYADGDGVEADMAQAAYWYGLAADQGLAAAEYRIATLYEKGRGVPKDDGKARALYEKAARQGNVKAMHNLAVIYAEGRGTRQDFTTAARWFGEAAEFGLGDSQYNLAILEERGLGVKQDTMTAYKWFSIAARNGDKGAAQKRDEIAAKLDAAALARAKVAAETWTPKRPDPVANGDLGALRAARRPGLPTRPAASRAPAATSPGRRPC